MKTMFHRSTRLISLFLVVLTVMTMMCAFATGADAATATKTQSFSNSGAYVTVKINNSLLNKSGKQYASVKLCSYAKFGIKSSANVTVTLTDTRGNVIWSGKKNTSCTLKLGDDHSVYRIYVRVYNTPVTGNIFVQSIIEGNNFTNAGKCVTWSIGNASNCSIS